MIDFDKSLRNKRSSIGYCPDFARIYISYVPSGAGGGIKGVKALH
jgi:NADPH-dependent 7-cyano-7-deazaguanine reductase QueF